MFMLTINFGTKYFEFEKDEIINSLRQVLKGGTKVKIPSFENKSPLHKV